MLVLERGVERGGEGSIPFWRLGLNDQVSIHGIQSLSSIE